jgi:hypothetical protein
LLPASVLLPLVHVCGMIIPLYSFLGVGEHIISRTGLLLSSLLLLGSNPHLHSIFFLHCSVVLCTPWFRSELSDSHSSSPLPFHCWLSNNVTNVRTHSNIECSSIKDMHIDSSFSRTIGLRHCNICGFACCPPWSVVESYEWTSAARLDSTRMCKRFWIAKAKFPNLPAPVPLHRTVLLSARTRRLPTRFVPCSSALISHPDTESMHFISFCAFTPFCLTERTRSTFPVCVLSAVGSMPLAPRNDSENSRRTTSFEAVFGVMADP